MNISDILAMIAANEDKILVDISLMKTTNMAANSVPQVKKSFYDDLFFYCVIPRMLHRQ